MSHELRYIESAEIRLDPDNPRRLSGYAVLWNTPSRDLGGFIETFSPHAFRDYLAAGADVRALVNHDTSKIIGRQSAGTLRVHEDEQGLAFSVDVPETTYGNDLLESVRRGDITGMSFGFKPEKDGDVWDRTQRPVRRTVKRAVIREISPVTFPAYEATRVFNRSADIPPEPAVCPDDLAHRRRLIEQRIRETEFECQNPPRAGR